MGLDMYLYKKSFVKNFSFDNPEKQYKVEVSRGGVLRTDIKPHRITQVVEEVGYWRKFNALHSWFVNNCGGGIDECQAIDVSEDDLRNLREVLVKVVENDFKTAEDDLPPAQGFFFGSDVVDDYYKECVIETINTIQDILNENEDIKDAGFYGSDFYYRASW